MSPVSFYTVQVSKGHKCAIVTGAAWSVFLCVCLCVSV